MRVALLVAVLTVFVTTAARAQVPGARPDNYYGAGSRVDITTAMPADVIVAGRDVTIRQPVAGDIVAAGWHVTLTAKAEDDVRVAGSDIQIEAPIAGDLTAAGGTVTLGPAAAVGGRSWITGHTVRLDGVLERDVNIAAATVVVNGELRQPAHIVAEHLEFGPTARVLASVTYQGPQEAVVADGATVSGPVSYTHIEPRDAQQARQVPFVSTFLFTMHLLIAGLLAVAFVPRLQAGIVDTLRRHPGQSVLAGFGLVIAIPMAALVLIASVVGLPFGLMLAAAYAVLVFAGPVTTAFVVGEWEGRLFGGDTAVMTRGRQALLLLAGVLTLAVLRATLGGLAVFVSILFGFGAQAVWIYHAMADNPATPVAA